MVYAFNYDRTFGAVAARLGVGVVPGRAVSSSGERHTEPLLVTAPLTLSYIGSNADWGLLESGAGVVLVHAAAHVSTPTVEVKDTARTFVVGTALIGYRFQPSEGGLSFRGGLSLLAGKGTFFPAWPYASLGYVF